MVLTRTEYKYTQKQGLQKIQLTISVCPVKYKSSLGDLKLRQDSRFVKFHFGLLGRVVLILLLLLNKSNIAKESNVM